MTDRLCGLEPWSKNFGFMVLDVLNGNSWTYTGYLLLRWWFLSLDFQWFIITLSPHSFHNHLMVRIKIRKTKLTKIRQNILFLLHLYATPNYVLWKWVKYQFKWSFMPFVFHGTKWSKLYNHFPNFSCPLKTKVSFAPLTFRTTSWTQYFNTV